MDEIDLTEPMDEAGEQRERKRDKFKRYGQYALTYAVPVISVGAAIASATADWTSAVEDRKLAINWVKKFQSQSHSWTLKRISKDGSSE